MSHDLAAPETPEAPATRAAPFGVARARVLQALTAYVAFNLLLPLVPIHHGPRTLAEFAELILLPAAAFMLLQLWLSRCLVGLRPRPRVCLAVIVISVVCWRVMLSLGHPYPHLSAALNLDLARLLHVLLALAITLACTFFGVLLSPIVREANVLLPVALIAMPVDYIGAMTKIGFTQNTLEHHPEVVQAVSVAVPAVGHLHANSLIGPGDVLFMAFFFAVVHRLHLNDRGTFWWMYGLLTLAMLLVLRFPINVAALVPMGLAVLLANGRFFRLKREEVFATLYAGLLVLGLVAGFFWFSHTHLFHAR